MSPVMAKALVDVSAESNRGGGQAWRCLKPAFNVGVVSGQRDRAGLGGEVAGPHPQGHGPIAVRVHRFAVAHRVADRRHRHSLSVAADRVGVPKAEGPQPLARILFVVVLHQLCPIDLNRTAGLACRS